MNQILKSALWYAKQGYSVIPILPPKADSKGKDEQKKPPIPWLPYQTQKATENEIREWFTDKPDMRVGIVTGHLSNLTIFDCDTLEAIQQIEELLPDNFRVPIAISPRGGRHYYFRHQPDFPNKANIAKGMDTRSEGGYIIAPPSIGLNGKGYSWLPGCGIHEVEPAELVGNLKDSLFNIFTLYIRESVDTIPSPQLSPVSTTVPMDFKEGGRDESLFHLANCLVKGGMNPQDIESFLRLVAVQICTPSFPKKEVFAKVQSAIKRAESKERNLSAEVRELIVSTSGLIMSPFVHNCLQVSTRQEKKTISQILSRLCVEGLIEKTGRIAGEFRIVSKDYDVLDANEIPAGKPLDIRLPFYLDHYVEILPGDLIVIAGTPNAGKTAILLDTIAHNMAVWECWYFSTELGPAAWARRRDKREPAVDWKFKFVHGFSNYEDIIKPDAMNFIDYVEQNEGEAYKIPGLLAKIQRKLRKGVAFVALQKNQGMEWGIGGQQTKAKPALFLTVEANYPQGARMRVVKAKAFKEYNPNGFYCDFKIIKGINLLETSGWGPEL
ncbi:MAG: bifunctional DNA primase/polymerase [Candidatus Margulisiibacteriota bacterium]